jgi:hypothetical protein
LQVRYFRLYSIVIIEINTNFFSAKYYKYGIVLHQLKTYIFSVSLDQKTARYVLIQ